MARKVKLPKEGEKARFNFYLPPELKNRLAHAAFQSGYDASEIIIMGLEKILPEIEAEIAERQEKAS